MYCVFHELWFAIIIPLSILVKLLFRTYSLLYLSRLSTFCAAAERQNLPGNQDRLIIISWNDGIWWRLKNGGLRTKVDLVLNLWQDADQRSWIIIRGLKGESEGDSALEHVDPGDVFDDEWQKQMYIHQDPMVKLAITSPLSSSVNWYEWLVMAETKDSHATLSFCHPLRWDVFLIKMMVGCFEHVRRSESFDRQNCFRQWNSSCWCETGFIQTLGCCWPFKIAAK